MPNMTDPIISQERILDRIILEDNFNYSVYTTIGLTEYNDFYVKLEFNDLDFESYKTVVSLYKLPKALKIYSDIITKENYNITHIAIEKFKTNNNLDMQWECLSDNPGLSLIIE